MKGYSVDNPVHDMEDAVADLYKMADMAEIIIEAIFNGDDVTLLDFQNNTKQERGGVYAWAK